MRSVTLSRWLDEKWYPGISGNWDDALLRQRVLQHVGPAVRLLDLGAGAGIVPQMNFKELVAHAAGVDLDERVCANPFLHAGHIGAIESLPLPDQSFDVVVCDNVLEHLDQPARVFAEVRRVLRPGGVFLAKTPNRHHYMPLIARATPLWFHRFINRARGRASIDTFPTRYRANSRKDLARLAREAGLEIASLQTVEGRPEYLRMWPVTYVAGHLYERLVNRFAALAGVRVILIVEMRRPA